ncbi:UNVERIFIED_ORG: hypothetical protein GGE64_002455 [Rhizobium etli]|nr:hypothetical protein Kim5_PC00218 [Rhizobium sp. Kim5]
MKITGIRTFLMHVGQPDPSNWAPEQRLGCDIDDEFVARFPSGGNVSVPQAAGAHNPGTDNEHVYVQTRVACRSYFNR